MGVLKLIVKNGYIIAVEESDAEYSVIMQKIQNKPNDPDGFQYKLRADNLEWEMEELPEPEPVDENADISDYENALSDLGVRFGD